MPLKKKSRPSPNTQPGVAKLYLLENFSVLPESLDDLKNGPVLHLFMSLERSRKKVEIKLTSNFSFSANASVATNSRIQVLLNRSLLKFKKLSNPVEFQNFTSICDERFDLPEECLSSCDGNSLPSPSAAGQTSESNPKDIGTETQTPPETPTTSATNDSPDCPSTSTRSSKIVYTPFKAKMKKKLTS